MAHGGDRDIPRIRGGSRIREPRPR